jgi:hypothetical protein
MIRKMKKILCGLLIASGLYGFCQQNDTLLRDLRFVPIKGRSNIKLQDNAESIKDISYKTAPGHYNLKKGSLPMSDSVDIEVNQNNQIIAVSFRYDTTYSYQKAYCARYFNAPLKSRQIEGADLEMKISRWEDKKTVFELVEMKKGDKPLVYATIFDKALYYKKYQPVLEKEKEVDSYEVLKQLKKL